MISRRRLPTLTLLLACTLTLHSTVASLAARGGALTVPQCAQMRFTAAYLAQVTPSEGPGFLLNVANDTDREIRLAKPFPSSAHWYAQAPGGKWLWRASSGSGGALVDAMRESGPLFAYRPPQHTGAPVEYVTIAAHQHLEWAESMHSNAALRFRPSCERCKNPEDRSYEAVLGYAYLAPAAEQVQGLLPCGLRSNLIVMPPLP